jgi:hypothetical protein
VSLEQTMADLLRELATHSPQGSVHAKTCIVLLT